MRRAVVRKMQRQDSRCLGQVFFARFVDQLVE